MRREGGKEEEGEEGEREKERRTVYVGNVSYDWTNVSSQFLNAIV